MKINIVELTTDGIEKKAEIDLDEKVDYVELVLKDMNLEELIEYQEFKRKRNKRVYEKMGYEYER